MTNKSQEYINKDNHEISLKELIVKMSNWCKYLLSKWIAILVFGLLGGALGFTYAYFKKPIYTATTTFVLEDEKGGRGLGSLAGLASMAGVDISSGGGGIFEGDNILELYKSRAMIQKTLLSEVDHNGKKQLLVDCYINFNQLRKSWNNNPKLKILTFNVPSQEKGFSRLQDSIISVIASDIGKNYLSVTKPDKKLSIIKADVKSNDEFFAKTFNDEIVKNVNDFYIQTKTKKSIANVKILQHKTDSVRAVMNGAIYTAASVTDATPNLNPTRQTQRVAPVQKSQFAAETNKAVLGELLKNLELSKMTLLKEAPLIQVIDTPVFPLSVSKFGKIKGFIIGGFLFGFFTICFLLLKKALKD